MTIDYGSGYAKVKIWSDLKAKLIITTQIISVTAKQPCDILLNHQFIREIGIKFEKHAPPSADSIVINITVDSAAQ